MKKIFSLLIAAMVMLTACQKEHEPKIENITIDVVLKQNNQYTYTINHNDDEYSSPYISQDTQHDAITALTPNDKNTASVFSYTPANDYVGPDQVIITLSEEKEEHGCGIKPGRTPRPHHHHHDESVKNYIFNFTIVQ